MADGEKDEQCRPTDMLKSALSFARFGQRAEARHSLAEYFEHKKVPMPDDFFYKFDKFCEKHGYRIKRIVYAGFFIPSNIARRFPEDDTIYAQLEGRKKGKLYAELESQFPFLSLMAVLFEYIKITTRTNSDEAHIEAGSLVEQIVQINDARGYTNFHPDAEKLERLFGNSPRFLGR